MRSVLILSRFFPPMFAVGGKRAYRFARHLPAFGWRAVVITSKATNEKSTDPSAGLPLPPEATVYRWYQSAHRSRGAKPTGSDGTTSEPTADDAAKPAPSWWQGITSQVQLPLGDGLVVAPGLSSSATEIGRSEGVDVVLATSSPYGALLAGAIVAERLGVPFVADLRDPWSLNFYQRRKPAWIQSSEAWLEGKLFERADKIIFTAQTAVDAYRQRYPQIPADRFVCIRNGFDEDQRPAAANVVRSDKVRLVHFGNCYGPRRLETVLRAIAVVRDQRTAQDPDIELLNLGRPAQSDIDLAQRLGIADCFHSQAFVPYQEGMNILAGSDLQVLLSYGEETLYLPAKLYDYLLSGAPVLALGKGDELAGILAATQAGVCVDPADVDATAAEIRRAVQARRDPTLRRTALTTAVRKFSAAAGSESLASLLGELVAARARASKAPVSSPTATSKGKQPLVSVIVPIRNRSGTRLENCLRSLRWQDIDASKVELILSDFGSNDEHAKSIDALAARYDARVVRTQTDEIWNRSRALNIGIQATRGLYVLNTDADMIFAPNFLSTLVDEQVQAQGRAFCVCHCRDLPETVPEQDWSVEDFPALFDQAPLREKLGTGACQFASRAHFISLRGYDEGYKFWGQEDNDMRYRSTKVMDLEERWIHQRTAMLHQWHPSDRGRKPLRKSINDIRFHMTKYVARKNWGGWGTR